MRTRILAANWKMNLSFEEADDLMYQLANALDKNPPGERLVVVCPPFPYLEMATDVALEYPLMIGAQNLSQFEKGAYTGEVSAEMLASMDVEFAIIGHSERRKFFQESDEVLAMKVNRALTQDIVPIFCCGESREEREDNQHKEVVRQQLEKGLFHLSEEDFSDVVIAYEPVWAIGTGLNATEEQAQEMHAMIRSLVAERYGAEMAEDLSILYGGSCNPDNAPGLFSQPDVDGGLIGGASLNAQSFIQMFNSL
jgi:triosephosphate isomerase